jgi:hypothetical protein
MLAWNKNGGTQFFSSEFFVLPEARLAILISGNNPNYGATALAEGLLLRTAVERGLIPAMPSAIVRAVPPVVATPDVSALLGIYANYTQPMQVLDAGGGALTLNGWGEGGWTPIQSGLRLRDDGWWWTDGITDSCYRFSEVPGHRYLTQRILINDLYWGENPQAEWLPEADEPRLSEAWRARLNVEWIITNEDPQSLFSGSAFTLTELPERPGYVMLSDVQLLRVLDDRNASMTVQIPVNNGRDLYELRFEGEGEDEEMHMGTMIFRRA